MGTYEQPGIIQPLAAQALAAAGTQIAKAGEVAMANITKAAIDNFSKNKKIDEENKKKQNAWGKEIGGIKTTKQGSFNENVGGFLENVGNWLFEVPNDPDLSAREIGIQEGRYYNLPDQVSACNQSIAPQLKEYIEMMKRDPNSIGGMDGLRTDPNWRAIMQDLDQNKGANVNYTYEGERLYLTYTDPQDPSKINRFDAEEFTRGSLKTKSMLQKVQDVSENKVIRGIVDQRVGKGQGGGGWAKIRYKELQGKNGIITDIEAWKELDADITKQIMNGDYSNVINDPQSMEGYWTRLQLDNGVEEKDLKPWMGNVDKESELFKEQRNNAAKWIPEYIDNNRDKFGMQPKRKEDPVRDDNIILNDAGTASVTADVTDDTSVNDVTDTFVNKILKDPNKLKKPIAEIKQEIKDLKPRRVYESGKTVPSKENTTKKHAYYKMKQEVERNIIASSKVAESSFYGMSREEIKQLAGAIVDAEAKLSSEKDVNNFNKDIDKLIK